MLCMWFSSVVLRDGECARGGHDSCFCLLLACVAVTPEGKDRCIFFFSETVGFAWWVVVLYGVKTIVGVTSVFIYASVGFCQLPKEGAYWLCFFAYSLAL